jgi:tetratricopeptide (TPR) repeat protein
VDLSLVQRWYPVGSDVIVYLNGGRSAQGRLEAMDADSLVLVTDKGPTLLLAKAIEQIEAAAPGSWGRAAPAEPAPAPERPPAPAPEEPAELSARWQSLAAEWPTRVGPVELSAPVFDLDPEIPLTYTDSKDIQGHLNRARNRLVSAQKLNESARAHTAIRDLAGAAQDLGYPPALHLAGLLLLKQGGTPAVVRQAEEWIARAAPFGGRYAWDLAVLRIRAGQDAQAAEALGEALRRAPAQDVDDRLLQVFVALVTSGDQAPLTVRALGAAVHAGAGPRLTATRAGLCLVFRLVPDRALPLERLLDKADPTPEDLCDVLEALDPGAGTRARTSPSSAAAGTAGHRPAGPAYGPPPAGIHVPPAARPAPRPDRKADGPIGPMDPQLHVFSARHQLDLGKFDNALKIAQAALAAHPGHRELLEIVDTAQRERSPKAKAPAAPARPAKVAPSRGRDSLYARAQHADTQEKDPEKAEQLYRQAIAAGDNTERAVRNLAWLLHRFKRSAEALEWLRDPETDVQDTLPHQNMIITILSDQGHWDEAAALLEDLLEGEHSKQNRTVLLKRLIVAYRKKRDFPSAKNAAERLLNHGPRNPEFRDILGELEKAERTGIWDKIDLLLAKSDWNPEQPGSISPILQLHLDHCEYSGVSAIRVQEGTLSEKDVHELDELVRKLGPPRSADRAAYNLTAARILRDLNQTDDARFRKSLRAFGAAMGDLCTAERRPGDVARTYYAEAVALGRWDEMGEVKVKQFLMSYLDPDWPQPESRPSLDHCLEWVLENDSLRRPVLVGLLGLANGSDQVGREIVSQTFRVADIRAILFKELCDYLGHSDLSSTQDVYVEVWQEALHRLRQELDAQRQSLQLPLSRSEPLGALAEDQQLVERARDLAPTTPLDVDRLKKVASTLGDIRGYLEQSSYLEQERLESKIRTGMRELVAVIEGNPTRLSLEYLVPLLTKLNHALGTHFGEVQQAAEPTELEVTQVLSSYVPNATSTIQVQLSVKNPSRRSPAVDVMLRVLDSPEDYKPVGAAIPVAHSLRDEQTETCMLALAVTPRAISEQILTLRYNLEFTVRSERRIVTEPATLPLRLNDSQDWKPIRNPYAEGAPVEDDEMFYGRDPLIQVLADSLERTDAKCVVIYGQKRVGKTSVLHHLKRTLKPPVLAANLSLLDIATDLDHPRLLYKIANTFYLSLQEWEDRGLPALDIPRPRLREFIDSGSPQIHFDDYMRDMLRQMRRSEAYKAWRLVLLMDEFTLLYTNIERGRLPREFMKSWKAMLESKLFSSVVVGNDLMPRFLKAFPNEFQVARQEPVSYLEEESAVALITEPIFLEDGDSRYRGDSVQRVIELTARSPYYIQLFCNRLVQHMNRERQALIGPADIDNVAAALVGGDRALPQEQFDNLLTPGDPDVSDLSEATVLAVLKGSLTGRRRDLHLDGRKARELPDGDRVIEDLVRRDVIVRESEDRYRIKVGLFAEWLWHRKA